MTVNQANYTNANTFEFKTFSVEEVASNDFAFELAA